MNTDGVDLYVRTRDCVNIAAGSIYRRFRRHVHLDDLRQELWLWTFAHRDTVTELLARSDGYLLRRLRGVAERYARKEKAASGGYSAADEVFYSLGQIVALLPDALDPYAIPSQGQSSEVTGKSERYMEWETNVADIRSAIAQLATAARNELEVWVWGGMVEPYPAPISAILRQMQKTLGGSKPNTGETT